MPAVIEHRCPRPRNDHPRDRFGLTLTGGRATRCLACTAAPRRPPPAADAAAIPAPRVAGPPWLVHLPAKPGRAARCPRPIPAAGA